jgi:hypothetical protein
MIRLLLETSGPLAFYKRTWRLRRSGFGVLTNPGTASRFTFPTMWAGSGAHLSACVTCPGRRRGSDNRSGNGTTITNYFLRLMVFSFTLTAPVKPLCKRGPRVTLAWYTPSRKLLDHIDQPKCALGITRVVFLSIEFFFFTFPICITELLFLRSTSRTRVQYWPRSRVKAADLPAFYLLSSLGRPLIEREQANRFGWARRESVCLGRSSIHGSVITSPKYY